MDNKHQPAAVPTQFDKLPPERAREIQSMGGKASAEVQRKKRNFQQAVKWAMDIPAQDLVNHNDKLINLLVKQYPDMTAAEAMAAKTTYNAIKNGDAKALAILRDTVGELPAQTVKLQQNEPVSITIRTVGKDAPTDPTTTPTLTTEEEPHAE